MSQYEVGYVVGQYYVIYSAPKSRAKLVISPQSTFFVIRSNLMKRVSLTEDLLNYFENLQFYT